jgi:T5SS/PEP-CTERM-associated repeat protein
MRATRVVALAMIVAGALCASPPRASADPAVTSAVGQVQTLTCQSGILFFNPVFHSKHDDEAGPTSTAVDMYDETVTSHATDPGGPSVTGAGNINQPNVTIGRMNSDSSVTQHTTVTSGADSVTVDSSATATAKKTHVVDNCCFSTIASSTTTFKLDVVVARRCRYQINGSISGASDVTFGASASISLTGLSAEPDLVVGVPGDSGTPTSTSIARSGVVDAGTVTLELRVASDLGGIDQARFHTSTGTQASATWNVSFSLSPDEPSDDILWTKSAGGAFATDANWNPQQVPVKDATHVDRAIFDVHGNYAVDFAAGKSGVKALGPAQTSDRLLVDQGDVTFENTNYKVDNPSVETPSLVVDTGSLTIASGQLTTNSAVIGDLHGVGAKIVVDGSGSRWDCLGRLRVGGSDGTGGDGELTISGGATVTSAESHVGAGGVATPAGGKPAHVGDGQSGRVTVEGTGTSWTTGNIAVGYSSDGDVIVGGGAKVSSGLVRVGLGSIVAAATVEGVDGAGTASEWDATALDFGALGGFFNVNDGGIAKVTDVFVDSDDFAFVMVGHVPGVHPTPPRSSLGCNSLTIGAGTVFVADGGDLSVAAGDAIVGNAGAGRAGELDVVASGSTVADPPSIDVSGDLVVGMGDESVGVLDVADGANATVHGEAQIGAQDASFGLAFVTGGATWTVVKSLFVGDPGQGTVSLDSSTINVGGDLNVAASGVLQGNGTIAVVGDFNNDGVLDSTVHVVDLVVPLVPLPKRAARRRTKTAKPTSGTLTIQGNLVVGPTGTVRVGSMGAQSDIVVVTGDATLDGTLVLQFRNGFAPRTGDHFELVHVNGAVTGGFATVDVRGLAPGAQFDVSTTGGALVATAKNSAVALPTVSVKASTKKLFEKRAKTKATLTFSRNHAAATPLTVTYALRGTATNGIDYVSLPGIVTIPAKKKSAKAVVQVVNDPFREGAETIDVVVLPGDDYTDSRAATARITIVDDD